MNTKIKNKIINHSKKQNPLEACGFIVEKNGDLDVIECQNISSDPLNNFKISANEFLAIKHFYNILYLYHSHTEEENFSIMDKKVSEEAKIDLVLYILNKNEFKHYSSNNSESLKYLGRSIDFQKTNCLDLVKLYYKNELKIDLITPKGIADNNLFQFNNSNLDLIFEYAEVNNLDEIKNSSFKINDIGIFNIDNYMHFAIYLGNNKILEQPRNGFSRIINYSNLYDRKKVTILRRK